MVIAVWVRVPSLAPKNGYLPVSVLFTNKGQVKFVVRFFVSPEEMQCDQITLTGDNAAHGKVLRLRAGEEVLVCDQEGSECICTIMNVNTDGIDLSVKVRQASQSEPAVKVSVYMAFPKGDKFEHVVQKSTELGAYEIIAFPSARCVSKPDAKSLQKKQERWQKIAESAAEQSGRGCVPRVIVMPSYKDALKRASESDKAILFYENEKATTLQSYLKRGDYNTVSIITGPEGGLEFSEVQQAMDAGIAVCTLGKRILRCETAPLCALSAIMYDSGEF